MPYSLPNTAVFSARPTDPVGIQESFPENFRPRRGTVTQRWMGVLRSGPEARGRVSRDYQFSPLAVTWKTLRVEGITKLSHTRDYNQVVKHVNSIWPTLFAVTSCNHTTWKQQPYFLTWLAIFR